jgi:hypothetical protein
VTLFSSAISVSLASNDVAGRTLLVGRITAKGFPRSVMIIEEHPFNSCHLPDQSIGDPVE